jgi:peptidoglycan/LPS O-acetylase OafA/YrhL
MVMVQHSQVGGAIFGTLPGQPTMPFYLGVHLFFVISGYVVTRSMFRGDVRPVAFLVRRFFRLVPAIAAFLLFSYFVFELSRPVVTLPANAAEEFRAQTIAILFGFLTLHAGAMLPYFGHMWSLSVEYQFYVAFALFALALVGLRCQKQTIRAAFFVLAAAVIVTCYAAGFTRFFSAVQRPEPAAISYLLNWTVYFLALGVALALAPERAIRGLRKLARWRLALGAIAFLTALAIASASGSPLDNAAQRQLTGLALPLIGALFALVVALATIGEQKREGRFYRLLVWIGDRSYSLYLFHAPVIALIATLVQMLVPWLWYVNPLYYTGVQFVALTALTFVLSMLTYSYVELPGTRLGSYLARQRTVRGRSASPGPYEIPPTRNAPPILTALAPIRPTSSNV